MLKTKKAQVTMFIIAGVILLIIASLFFYIKSNVAPPFKEGKVKAIVEQLPTEFQPIGSFIDFCLIETSKNAIKKLGEQGGYIYPEDYGITITSSHNSDGIYLAKNFKIAYWYYMKSPNDCKENCEFIERIPSLKEMEEQLSRYIEENINLCLNNFTIFKQQGYNFEQQEPIKIESFINKNDVSFLLKTEIRIKRGDNSVDLQKRYITLPVNLMKMYNLAKDITEKEAESSYLELHTLNLITGFSEVNPEKLPPMAATEFKMGTPTMWIKSNVKEKIKEILMSYLQFIRLKPSLNYIVTNSEIYNAMTLPSLPQYSDLAITFSYLGFFPLYFNLNCNGEICKPDELNILGIFPIGFKRYNFVYDITYPVLVEITDPLALNQEGYSFRFALEVNIRNNEPFKPESRIIEPINLAQSSFCDVEMRNSPYITIKVIDAQTQEPVEGANIAYKCLSLECNNFIPTDYNGVVTQKFPTTCLAGGKLIVSKEGYLGKLTDFTPKKEETLTFKLWPKKEINFKIMKYELTKIMGRWALIKTPKELNKDEEATLVLTRISKDEEPYIVASTYTKNSSENKLTLVPGNYRVEINLVDRGTHVIPPRTIKKGNIFHKEKIHLPGVTFNRTNPYSVSVVLKNETPNHYYYIGKKIYSNDMIIFYIIKPLPEKMSDVRELQIIDQDTLSNSYRTYLEPKIVKAEEEK